MIISIMTNLKIINGQFYINGSPANNGDNLKQGRLLGVCTDLCAFFHTSEFRGNLKYMRDAGINIFSASFQSPNPSGEYYKKSREQDKNLLSFSSFSHSSAHSGSAINCGGDLDYDFLAGLELTVKTADSLGLAVLINILDSSREYIFTDEFAVITGIFNAADWLISKKFTNVIVNLTNISHTFYKSSVLNGEKFINIFKDIKNSAGDNLILGAGLKSFAKIGADSLGMYIGCSDFIPIYSVNYKTHSTKKMLDNIYFFKSRTDAPVIMAKGDDLSDRYNSYGKNSMTEAFENNISWFYYNLDKLGLEPVDWSFFQSFKL